MPSSTHTQSAVWNICDFFGIRSHEVITDLRHAIEDDEVDKLALLVLEYNIDLNEPLHWEESECYAYCSHELFTPFEYAIKQNCYGSAKLLLKVGAQVTYESLNMLLQHRQNANKEMLKLLIENNIQPEIEHLLYAMRFCNYDLVKGIVNSNPALVFKYWVNPYTQRVHTPLSVLFGAPCTSNTPEILKFFVRIGVTFESDALAHLQEDGTEQYVDYTTITHFSNLKLLEQYASIENKMPMIPENWDAEYE